MLTFKKFADIMVKVEEIEIFLNLKGSFDITVERLERASINRNGRNIPQNFYMVSVSYENPMCLFELGFEMGKAALTKL